MKKKKNLPETPEEILSYVTPHRMAAWKKKAEEGLATYFFIMSRRHRHIAWCSHCHHFVRLRVSRHRREDVCPHCGSIGEQIHGWRGYSRLHDRVIVCQYANADGALIAAVLYAAVQWHREEVNREGGWKLVMPWRIRPVVALDSVSIFRYGEGGVMACPSSGRQAAAGVTLDHVMRPHARWGCYSGVGMGTLPLIRVDDASISRAIAGTPFHYTWDALSLHSRVASMENDGALKVLNRIAEYPFASEALAKMGWRTQDAVIRANHYPKLINWRGKTLRAVLRGALTKEEKMWLHDARPGACLTPDILKGWQELRKKGVQQTLLPDMAATRYGSQLYHSLPDVAPGRVMRYLKKTKCRKEIYIEYISMCRDMDVDLTSKSNLFPRDPDRAHDAILEHLHTKMALEIQEKERKEAQAQDSDWEKRRAAVERRYRFTADGITIRVPEKMEELIDEGNAMHNCVGTYVRRVASGSTIVVFIRTEDTDERLGTMEIAADGTHIVQARAAFNADLPQDVQAFVDKFEAEKINPIGMAG